MSRDFKKMKSAVTVTVPGTCGEWIQTLDNGIECLVSLPIDRFTILKVSFKGSEEAVASQHELLPKSRLAFQRITAKLELPQSIMETVHFEYLRRLEIGKGMASSTADIVSVLYGVSALMGEVIDEETLLEIACQIEPSDGIMFDHLVLIDHINGKVLEHYSTDLNLKLLMLKPNYTFETETLRANSDYTDRVIRKTAKPLLLFREGIREKSLEKIGEASTLSLLENERVLEKPFLKELIAIAADNHCYGIVGGHSGTVCGILLDSDRTDLSNLLKQIENTTIGDYYASYEIVTSFCGGIQQMVEEDQ